MAYRNYLYSCSQEQIEALHQAHNETLQPTRLVACSHLIAYGVQIQPLGELLGQALDGGEVLHPNFEHPFRVPKLHNVAEVARLSPLLKEAARAAFAEEPLAEEDWFRAEIEKVVNLFAWAHSREECVVSSLPIQGANPAQFPQIT